MMARIATSVDRLENSFISSFLHEGLSPYDVGALGAYLGVKYNRKRVLAEERISSRSVESGLFKLW